MRAVIDGIGIKAISVAVPKQKRGYDDLAKIVGEKNAGRICQNTGINFVRVSKDGETAADYCEAAAKMVLAETTNVSGVVFVSQTPDYILPATSCVLQHKLGLPSDVVCYDVNAGCTGFIKGLHLASMIASSTEGDVLLLVGDTMTKHVSPKDHSLFLLMGDAGSATLVSPIKESRMAFNLKTHGEGYKSLMIPAGGNRLLSSDASRQVVECEKGNWRSQEHLYMDGMSIMLFALSKATSLIEEESAVLTCPPDLYVFHQANEFIVKSMAKNLKLDSDKVILSVKDYGNTGPASIPLALCDTLPNHSQNIRKNALLAGFGVGLTLATLITDLSNTKFHAVQEI
ncbi:MAG: ketoacyl-ACP synthase III [Cloacibacillus sp.]